MHGVFVTWEHLRHAGGSGERPDLVVYLGDTSEPARSIVERIKRFVDANGSSASSICVVAPAFRENQVEAIRDDAKFVDLATQLGVDHHAYLFDRRGAVGGLEKPRLTSFQRRVLTRLVRSRHGILEGEGAIHYAKPSGRHADQFIRIGNVLVSDVEIEMIAWASLPHFPDDTPGVYTDTGAINIVASSIRDLLRGFKPASPPHFTIDSFGSYAGLQSFEARKDGLWLISATTSGGLASTIAKHHEVKSDRVVSLFSLGVPNVDAVCRLDVDDSNPSGFNPIKSYPDTGCQLCRRGSTALWLTDEQFLVADATISSYLPRRDDLPKTTLTAIHQLIGHGVFRVGYPLNPLTENSDVFLDLEAHVDSLLSDEPKTCANLASVFRRRVRQSLPAAVDLIVTLNDDASAALGAALLEHARGCGSSQAKLVRAAELPDHVAAPVRCVVVAAASVASGTSVIDVSRDIRAIPCVESISYFVLVDRSSTDERARQTSLGVVFTDDDHRFDYHVTSRLPLPDPSALAQNAWDRELELIQRIIEWSVSHPDPPEATSPDPHALLPRLNARKETLEQAKSKTTKGLKDALFWENRAGDALELSKGFVFLPSDCDPSGVSQADVYSVIQALLHSMRIPSRQRARGKEPPLKQHPLHRKVLDVGVFYRFNDSVLHAAILRAAAPGELDYSHPSTTDQSASARLLLCKVFLHDPSSAATEFALALALGRLRLSQEDKKQVLDQIGDQPFSPATKAFLDEWRQANANK